MDKFLKYFEDKQFVQWVLKPNKQLETYWKIYLEENPSEKKQIELARLLIFQLQSKKSNNSGNEAIDLFSDIVLKLGEKNKKTSFRSLGITVLKYAAVAFLFFSIGILVYYEQKPDLFAGYVQSTDMMASQNDAHLILGNGENVAITEKESTVEYQVNGEIVINNHDTIQSVSKSKSTELNQLVVPFGKNSSIRLPDGTIASLNAGSRLIYPSKFEGKNREVYLIGEGFFEVSHNADMPFIVKTSDLQVEVLGTKFNLSAYPSDSFIETVLVEGKVKLIENAFQIVKGNFVLEPNQLASYNRENAETKIAHVDVRNYVAWHHGYLNFESSDLSRIVKKLERYYNIQIRLGDPMLGSRTISGKLKLKEEIDGVLTALASTASAELVKINESIYVVK